jgi:hypothetical protein
MPKSQDGRLPTDPSYTAPPVACRVTEIGSTLRLACPEKRHYRKLPHHPRVAGPAAGNGFFIESDATNVAPLIFIYDFAW